MAYAIYLTPSGEDVDLHSNIPMQILLNQLSPTWKSLRDKYDLYTNDGKLLPLTAIDDVLDSLEQDIETIKTSSNHESKNYAVDYLTKVIKLVEKYKAKDELNVKALVWW